jgi:hypothetical protein
MNLQKICTKSELKKFPLGTLLLTYTLDNLFCLNGYLHSIRTNSFVINTNIFDDNDDSLIKIYFSDIDYIYANPIIIKNLTHIPDVMQSAQSGVTDFPVTIDDIVVYYAYDKKDKAMYKKSLKYITMKKWHDIYGEFMMEYKEPNLYVCLTENNEHEGESWNFYIKLNGNEYELNKLERLIEYHDKTYLYELTLYSPILENEVETIIKHTDHGYMAYNNLIDEYINLPSGFDIDDLYKGGIRDFEQSTEKSYDNLYVQFSYNNIEYYIPIKNNKDDIIKLYDFILYNCDDGEMSKYDLDIFNEFKKDDVDSNEFNLIENLRIFNPYSYLNK